MKGHFLIKIICLLVTNLIVVLPIFSQTDNPESIDIKTRTASNTVPPDLIKSVSLLPVEFKPDAMIKSLSKVQFDGSKFYLLNSINAFSQNLISITKEGKIDQVLNRTGKGPGEYQMISDFNVDPLTKDLWIYDAGKQHYTVYSPDLRFNKSFPANKEFTPGMFLFTPWDTQNILISSLEIDYQAGKMVQSLSIVREGKVVNKFLDLGELRDGATGGAFRLQGFSGAIDFFPPFSSDIYRINKMGCHAVYRISFDEPTIKPGTVVTSSMHPEIFNQTFYESDTYLLIECMIRNKVYLTFYNKKSHQVTTCQNPWNDKMGEGYLFQIIGMADNKLVMSTTNIDVREVVSKLDPTGTRLINKTVLDQIDPESQLANPILVLVELN